MIVEHVDQLMGFWVFAPLFKLKVCMDLSILRFVRLKYAYLVRALLFNLGDHVFVDA